MIVVNNQPVNFEVDPFKNPYVNEVKYAQLVKQGDVTQFQFQTGSIFDSRNVLINPTFQLNLNGWYQLGTYKNFEWNDGVLYYSRQELNGDRKASTIIQDALVVGVQYEIKLNINRSQNGYFEIYFGTNRVAQKTAGVHTVSGVCEGSNQLKIKFIPTLPRIFALTADQAYTISVGSIDYIFCTEKTTNNHIFPIVEQKTDIVIDTLNAINDYLSDPYTASSDAQFVETSLTMNLDWQDKGIANGCYRIGVCDADINTNLQCGTRNSELFGGSGDNLPNWTLTTTGTGSIQLFQTYVKLRGDNPGFSSIKQTGLKAGVTYNYAIEILAITGSTQLDIAFGTQTDSYLTTGIKTGTITSDGTDLEVSITTNALSESISVGYIRIQAVAADLEPDYYSNPFDLATNHNRTVLINCNNTENIFNLNYETALFTPRLRLKGYVAPADQAYDSEREFSETTFGRRDVYYFKRRKSSLLVIENEPEFIHDWLSLLAGHDHAMINNLEYFITEDDYPRIEWDKYRVKGSTQLPIQEKQQLERKIVKGEVKTAQFIEDNDGDGIVGGLLTFPEINETDDMSPRLFPISDPSNNTILIRTPESTTLDELTPNN